MCLTISSPCTKHLFEKSTHTRTNPNPTANGTACCVQTEHFLGEEKNGKIYMQIHSLDPRESAILYCVRFYYRSSYCILHIHIFDISLFMHGAHRTTHYIYLRAMANTSFICRSSSSCSLERWYTYSVLQCIQAAF